MCSTTWRPALVGLPLSIVFAGASLLLLGPVQAQSASPQIPANAHRTFGTGWARRGERREDEQAVNASYPPRVILIPFDQRSLRSS